MDGFQQGVELRYGTVTSRRRHELSNLCNEDPDKSILLPAGDPYLIDVGVDSSGDIVIHLPTI